MFGKRSASVMGVPITAILPAGDVVSRIEAKENRIVSEALHGDGSVFEGKRSGADGVGGRWGVSRRSVFDRWHCNDGQSKDRFYFCPCRRKHPSMPLTIP